MQTWAEEALTALQPNYPGWEIWVVRHHMGPDAWCARPKGSPVATINTDSPEQLIEAIRSAEQERWLYE